MAGVAIVVVVVRGVTTHMAIHVAGLERRSVRIVSVGKALGVPFKVLAAVVRAPFVLVGRGSTLRRRVEDHKTEMAQALLAAAAAIFTLGLVLLPFAGADGDPAPVLSPPTTAPPTTVAQVQTAPAADVVAPVEPAIEGDLPAD